MTTFNFSAPAGGGGGGFNFSVTGTLQTVTQPDTLNNPTNVSGYVLTSASGVINGQSVSLYTGGSGYDYDIQLAATAGFTEYNNVIKVGSSGDFGNTVSNGIDNTGLLLQSSSNLFNVFYTGSQLEIDVYDLSGSYQSYALYNTSAVTSEAPCFATGVRLRTDRGETAVEDLTVGDRLVTLSGEARPVIWIGRKTVDCARHSVPEAALPICVREDALAPGLPARDLWLSPDHSLYFDGALIPAKRLVNGATITRETVAAVTYWHVELASHDIAFAEGVAAETYLADGNRHLFDGEERRDEPRGVVGFPVVEEGARVVAVRRFLWERAVAMGGRALVDPGLHVVADGDVVTPSSVADGRFVFHVPDGATQLRLRSRAARPCDLEPGGSDTRRLGVRIFDVTVDGSPVASDHAAFEDGWHSAEGGGTKAFRWTNGDASLPLGREIAIAASWLPIYKLKTPARPAPTPPATSEAKVIRFKPVEARPAA